MAVCYWIIPCLQGKWCTFDLLVFGWYDIIIILYTSYCQVWTAGNRALEIKVGIWRDLKKKRVVSSMILNMLLSFERPRSLILRCRLIPLRTRSCCELFFSFGIFEKYASLYDLIVSIDSLQRSQGHFVIPLSSNSFEMSRPGVHIVSFRSVQSTASSISFSVMTFGSGLF